MPRLHKNGNAAGGVRKQLTNFLSCPLTNSPNLDSSPFSNVYHRPYTTTTRLIWSSERIWWTQWSLDVRRMFRPSKHHLQCDRNSTMRLVIKASSSRTQCRASEVWTELGHDGGKNSSQNRAQQGSCRLLHSDLFLMPPTLRQQKECIIIEACIIHEGADLNIWCQGWASCVCQSTWAQYIK